MYRISEWNSVYFLYGINKKFNFIQKFTNQNMNLVDNTNINFDNF